MTITVSHLEKLGKLTRLAINPETAPALAQQLSSILGLIETMQAVDTTNIAPLAHPTALVNDVALRLRDDVITEPTNPAIQLASRDVRMQNAPATEAGYFLVPRVLE